MNCPIPEKYSKLIQVIRDIARDCGFGLTYSPNEWGLNHFFKSNDDQVHIIFDYGYPTKVVVPEGEITPLGGGTVGDKEKLLKLLFDRLGLIFSNPQRDDTKIDSFTYQISNSGPDLIVTKPLDIL